MDIHDFRKLIEAYGTNSDVWPQDQKLEAFDLLKASNDAAAASAAAAIIVEFESLDNVLNADIVDEPAALKLNILSKIDHIASSESETRDLEDIGREPEAEENDLLGRLWHWLAPSLHGATFIWRPAMAACIPLLAGVYLGVITDTSTNENVLEWEEDIYVMGLLSETEEEE